MHTAPVPIFVSPSPHASPPVLADLLLGDNQKICTFFHHFSASVEDFGLALLVVTFEMLRLLLV